MAQNIDVSVTRIIQIGNVTCVRVTLPTSTVDKKAVNEWPVILNGVATSAFVQSDQTQGFTYTFPFALGKGIGFPYCLSMQLEEEEPIEAE